MSVDVTDVELSVTKPLACVINASMYIIDACGNIARSTYLDAAPARLKQTLLVLVEKM